MVFAITYTGTLFFEPIPSNYHRHIQSFASRPFLPSYHVPFPELVELGLDVHGFVRNLGWEFLLNQPFSSLICPDLVRYFFSNFRSPGLASRSFSSIVFGHLFTLHLDDLSETLHIPRVGEALADASELELFAFQYPDEFHQLTGVLPASGMFMPVSALLPSLRLLHYCITRLFVPRAESLDLVLPLDLWIMSHAVHGVPLDYAHLVFGQLLRLSDAALTGPLAFGPLVTSLLLELHLHLSPFLTVTPSLYPLAYHILDDLEIAVEGENAVEGETDVVWVSSSSDDSSSSGSSDDGPGLEPFVEALQALLEYGSDDVSDGA
ncbi:unnamed protein product [Linum trigynum]|uniref:Uncharacterized protein n=1 Tax=Linum trigynum TaxID=586398 RepID=A0AAV2EZR1_9ROSI